MRLTRQTLFLSLASAALILIGCDTRVEVLQPAEAQQYSLYGWLDVAADTQAIRVEPLADSSQLGSPLKLDANVFLRDPVKDTTVALRDSVHTVNPESYRNPTQVHTFWTTYQIFRSTSYRISVKENGETVTTATTTTPATPPVLGHNSEFFLPCPTSSGNDFWAYAYGVEEVAGAKVIYPATRFPEGYDRVEEGYPAFNVYDTMEEFSHHDNSYGIDINYQSHGFCSRRYFQKPYAMVVVAAGGPDWPGWREASFGDLAQPDTFSNVRGGAGFVGAVFSDTVRVPIRSPEPAP